MMASAMLLLATKAGAGGMVTIQQTLNGERIDQCATISEPVVNNGMCSFSITNISSLYTIDAISYTKTVAGNSAQSRSDGSTLSRRKAPDIDTNVTAVDYDEETGNCEFEMPEGDYDLEVTVNFRYNSYGITVNGKEITGENLYDVLGLGNKEVSFDGKSTIVLKNYSDENAEIACNGSLTIFIIGNNKVKAISTGTAEDSLMFETDKNNPGKIEIGQKETGSSNIFSGFKKTIIGKGLSLLSPANATINDPQLTYAEIGPYISPIVSTDNEGGEIITTTDPVQVVFTNTSIEENTDLTNITINNVVITLSDDDGYNEVKGSTNQVAIVLNTAVEDTKVNNVADKVAKGELEPGSEDYAAAFTGLTFMVPAGSGVIKLKMEITEGYALNVKVGKTTPITFTKSTEGEEEAMVPYVCAQPEYVYIYNATPEAATARKKANSQAIFRERKTGGHIRLTSFLVDPAGVLEQNKPEAQRVVSAVETAMLTFDGGKVRIGNGSVNTLSDGFFKQNYAPDVLAAIKSINLSGTDITGVEVSRARGAFEEVPENVVIYMPAGNTTGVDSDGNSEPNIVIGDICDNLQMPGDNQNYEGMDMDFSAQIVNFSREFSEDQTSTVFLPFGINKDAAKQLGDFYSFVCINAEGVAELEPVTEGTEAHKPYIFIKHTNNGQLTINNVRVKGELPTSFNSAKLIGTYTQKIFTDDEETNHYYYGYAAEDKDDVKAGDFVRIGAGATIKAFRAYLDLDEDQGARISIDWGDEATGITSIHAGEKTTSNNIYDLQGRRVNTLLKPGIYIKNSKKIIIK